jgi:hypothetical protein
MYTREASSLSRLEEILRLCAQNMRAQANLRRHQRKQAKKIAMMITAATIGFSKGTPISSRKSKNSIKNPKITAENKVRWSNLTGKAQIFGWFAHR